MQLNSVVVGFDFSPTVVRAASWVHRCLAPNAQLTLVHAVEPDPLPVYLRHRFSSKADWVAEEEARAHRNLQNAARDHELGNVALVVRRARPHELLRTWVTEASAELLVIGAHREPTRPWRRVGSTTERLMRTAETSVLVARGMMEAAPRRILVAVDDAGVTPTLLDWAVALRCQFDARLIAVHVLSNVAFSHIASVEAGRAHSEDAARRLLFDDIREEARRWLGTVVRAAGVTDKLDVAIPHGVPADEILAAADDFSADLIVIGRYGLGRIVPAVLGSVVGSVVHGASCPVLVVSDARPAEL